jgi:hypothetical protein
MATLLFLNVWPMIVVIIEIDILTAFVFQVNPTGL